MRHQVRVCTHHICTMLLLSSLSGNSSNGSCQLMGCHPLSSASRCACNTKSAYASCPDHPFSASQAATRGVLVQHSARSDRSPWSTAWSARLPGGLELDSLLLVFNLERWLVFHTLMSDESLQSSSGSPSCSWCQTCFEGKVKDQFLGRRISL